MVIEVSCVVATLFFTTGSIVRIVYYAQERKRDAIDWDAYTELDPTYIHAQWDYRISKQAMWLSSTLLNAFGWLAFAYPIILMAWLLSKQGTRGISYNFAIMLLALGGTLTEWLANLFWIGMTMATEKLAQNFNLDNWVRNDIEGPANDGMGWRTLELNHIAGSGVIWFVDAFEWLTLSGLFLCTFVSVRRWRKEDGTVFSPRWNSLTLFMGLLCLLEFFAETLRFQGYQTFGPVAMVYAALNRLILMPAWLISLGLILPRIKLQAALTDVNPIAAELALAELSSAVDATADGAAENGDEPPPQPINHHPSTNGVENGVNGKANPPTPASPSSPPPEAFAQPSETP